MGGPVRADERHPVIKARRVSFDWQGTPLHWIPGEPVATHLVNCFHLILPTAERWYIQCVKEALPEITNERLRAEIKGFIGQEMVHARSHQKVLEDILEAHGIDYTVLTRASEKQIGARPAKRAKIKSARWLRLTLLFDLAMVAAFEHYTAVMGQWILDDKGLDRAGADPTMMDLLRWHGAEEVEHRAVVYDVYHALGGRYPMRAIVYLLSSALLLYGLWPGALELLRQDPSYTQKVTFPRAYRAYLRAARRGVLPSLGRMVLKESMIYLSPRFHPSKVGSLQSALDYVATSPAAQAAAAGMSTDQT